MAISLVTKRDAPWCGIGVQGQWTDYHEALHAGQLDFNVIAKDAKVELDKPFANSQYNMVYYETVPNVQVNIRERDNEILGCVSNKYGIIQNEEAFSLLQPFTSAGGVITNVGMTEQGLCFMVLRMRMSVILGDDWDYDVMCCNSFNGMFPCSIIMVPTRIICQNMYRKLMGRNDMLLHIRHGRLAPDRLKAANQATGKVLSYQAAFESQLMQANSLSCPKERIEDVLVPMLFPYPKPGGDREQLSRERVDQLREEFIDVYYMANDNRKFHGKAMGFINAYYDYLSHRPQTKCMPGNWDHKKLSGLVSGSSIKTSLIKEALK